MTYRRTASSRSNRSQEPDLETQHRHADSHEDDDFMDWVPKPKREDLSRVVVVRDRRCVGSDGKVIAEVLSGMVSRATVALMEEPSISKAFGELFSPRDTVVLMASEGVHPVIVEPLLRGLLTAGVKSRNMVLFVTHPYRRHNGRADGNGFEGIVTRYGLQVGGHGFHHTPETVGKVKMRVADVLYESDAIINLSGLQNQESQGMPGSLGSAAASVREGYKLQHNGLERTLKINALPMLQEKTRLVVCDATQPVFEVNGRPEGARRWNYCGVIASRDPVALDTVGAAIIGQHRALVGLESSMRKTKTALTSAAALGLGNTDQQRIDLLEIDV